MFRPTHILFTVWKDACKRDMTQAWLKEDNARNRADWHAVEKEANQVYRRPQMTGQARDEEETSVASDNNGANSRAGCQKWASAG